MSEIKKNYFLKSSPQRGEIWLGKVDKIQEISKDFRPVLVISNNLQNELNDKIIIVPVTTEQLNIVNPFYSLLGKKSKVGLDKNCKILLNYPFTIQKDLRLKYKLGFVNEEVIKKVKIA